ncbi:MAG: hypothetical protein SGILL_001478 [Bacillariaceae sp.]
MDQPSKATAAAPAVYSLLDDVSTIKSDTDNETLATEDTFPLKHESDNMFPDRPSEHSRLLTDDDRSFNTWSTKRSQRGGSSVNTGSTYEETPFLPREPLQQVPEQDDPGKKSAESEPHPTGYAFEMFFETRTMLEEAKTTAGNFITGLFNDKAKSQEQREERQDPDPELLTSVNGMLGAASDSIDKALLKIFDVRSPDGNKNQKYAVSVNQSLTNDYRHVFDAAVGSTSYPTRPYLKPKKEVKPDRSESSSTRSQVNQTFNTPAPESFIAPVNCESRSVEDSPDEIKAVDEPTAESKSMEYSHSEGNYNLEDSNSESKSMDDSPEDSKESVEEEHSDIRDDPSDVRDDLDEVLSDSYVPDLQSTDTQDSIAKFKESLYAGMMDKRESNSTASSIDSDAKKEDSATEKELGGSDTESVARVLDKYMKGSSLVPLCSGENLQAKIVSEPDFVDLVDEDSCDGAQVGLSVLHKRHVVDLINRNLTATNRSNFIDLSSIDPTAKVDEEQKESTSAPTWPHDSHRNSTRRSGHTSSAAKCTSVQKAEDAEQPWHSSAFAEVEEIDNTLNMRREKLRKMMRDLDLSLDKAQQAFVSESREGTAGTLRDVESENRALMATDTSNSTMLPKPTSLDQPIDLTLYDECF